MLAHLRGWCVMKRMVFIAARAISIDISCSGCEGSQRRTNPYNTSVFGIKGLPPGPIDSVDQTTLEAALNPTDTTDLYFCAVDGSVLYAANSTAWATLGKAHPGLCGN